jgi:hypothetical protein
MLDATQFARGTGAQADATALMNNITALASLLVLGFPLTMSVLRTIIVSWVSFLIPITYFVFRHFRRWVRLTNDSRRV